MTKTTEERPQCAERVWNGYHASQCRFRGRFFEHGRWWCKTHAPSTAKAKRDAADARWEHKRAVDAARWEVQETRDAIADMVIDGRAADDPAGLEEAAERARAARRKLNELYSQEGKL